MGTTAAKGQSSSSPGADPRKMNYGCREAYHAGSWYPDQSFRLEEQLNTFLHGDRIESETIPHEATNSIAGSITAKPDSSLLATSSERRLRAILVPHAGYSYSGPTAAYAYDALRKELMDPSCPIQRILVLHPSHHVYLDGCAVSGAMELATPLGNLRVDEALRQQIRNTLDVGFTVMKKQVDEAEHSGEMQFPFLAKVLKDTRRSDITVLPVMCGALTNHAEERYGKALQTIIDRPDVCTVVSSDFCHWGKRFSYQPTPPPEEEPTMPIHQFIERMDRRGMDWIQLQQPGAFAEYLKETRNTICGRHAIAVWLNAVASMERDHRQHKLQVKFVHYAQSSAVESKRDSSVSYAAAVAIVENR